MPLSPHEMSVLADLEEELRADDPALAAALSRPVVATAADREPRPVDRTQRGGAQGGARRAVPGVVFAVVPVLVGLALLPAAGQPLAALVLALALAALLPRLVVQVVERFERSGRSRRGDG